MGSRALSGVRSTAVRRKQWMATLALCVLLAPSTSIPGAADDAHGCSGSVCACGHRVAPVAAPSVPTCHKAAAPRCAMRGSCQHDAPPVAVASPYVLPVPVSLAFDVSVPNTPPGVRSVIAPGYRRLEAPPPKAA
jgi:hypothetical protein